MLHVELNLSKVIQCNKYFIRTYVTDTLHLKDRSRTKKIFNYFLSVPHLKAVKGFIPDAHFKAVKKLPDHLYLVDTQVAKDAVSCIMPYLSDRSGVICETNAGMGLITSELESNNIEKVQLFESCPEFIKVLEKKFGDKHELHPKDFYRMPSLSFIDRIVGSNKIGGLMKNVTKREWHDDPVMTVIGPMANPKFLNYFIRTIAYQSDTTIYGRIQLFAFVNKTLFLRLTSKVGDSLLYYNYGAFLIQMFCNINFIKKYPRHCFLPWARIDQHLVKDEFMYLVQINCKEKLPTDTENLLNLFCFVKQLYRSGKRKVIPTIDKWFPRIGIELLAPADPSNVIKNLNVFTMVGDLTPEEMLTIFNVVLKHPNFKSSSFINMVETMSMKYEAVLNTDSL